VNEATFDLYFHDRDILWTWL